MVNLTKSRIVITGGSSERWGWKLGCAHWYKKKTVAGWYKRTDYSVGAGIIGWSWFETPV